MELAKICGSRCIPCSDWNNLLKLLPSYPFAFLRPIFRFQSYVRCRTGSTTCPLGVHALHSYLSWAALLHPLLPMMGQPAALGLSHRSQLFKLNQPSSPPLCHWQLSCHFKARSYSAGPLSSKSSYFGFRRLSTRHLKSFSRWTACPLARHCLS